MQSTFLSRTTLQSEITTHLKEVHESRVLLLLILNLISRNGIVWDIFQVRVPEIKGGIKYGSGNARDTWVVFALDMMKLVDKPLVVHSNILYVAEDLLEELGSRSRSIIGGSISCNGVIKILSESVQICDSISARNTLLMLCKSFTYSISFAMSSKIILEES